MDEESRHAYHKSPALLQVVCTILESYLAEAGTQLQLIDADKRMGFWIAMMHSPNADELTLHTAVDRVNAQFPRRDEATTAEVEDVDAALLTVRITDKDDFSQLL